MQLYNTLTHSKQSFTPVQTNQVGMYACGITAYDYCHIGHARSAIFFDVLARYLRHKGYKLTFVRNFTDIDDKIINRANREKKTSTEIAEFFILAFHQDMDRLNVRRADIEPKATEYMPEMINLCSRLIGQGHAYATDVGDVYFRVRSFPQYGKLSGRDIDDLRSGARVAPGEQKEDPLDFALWKAAKPNEPFWESPWGKGRPGWHLECSAMSEKNLTLPLDIHGGGQDLIFPHHENEIAQTEASTGKEMARFWVHNGFVQIDSEKMSKSLGNFKTIRDILEERQPESLRFFLLGKHYRSPIDFNFQNMDEAERGLKRIYECLAEVEAKLEADNWKAGDLAREDWQEFEDLTAQFYAAMDDDCNSAAALGHIFNLVRLINRLLEDKTAKNKTGLKSLLDRFHQEMGNWSAILGVFAQNPRQFLLDLRKTKAARLHLDPTKVEDMLAVRLAARQAKDFAKADQVRTDLESLGVVVRDTPQGQIWDLA